MGRIGMTSDHDSTALRSRGALILLGVIILLGSFLRIYRLGDDDLWTDEIFTALFSRGDNSLVAVVTNPLSTPIPSLPLWFLVTHLFVVVLGESEFIVRLPAAIFGLLGIVVSYQAAKAMFGREVGLSTAFLLAISPFHIRHSQEARYYPAVLLFSILGLFFLHCAVVHGKRKWWIAFVLATLANLYTHNVAWLLLLSEVLFVALIATRDIRSPSFVLRRLVGPLVASLLVITVSYLPMVSHFLAGALGPRGIGNEGLTEGLDLSWSFLERVLAGLGGGSGIIALFCGAAFLWGVIVAWKRNRREILLTLCCSIAPFWAIFLARPRHFFDLKYVIFVLPLYLGVVSVGIIDFCHRAAYLWSRGETSQQTETTRSALMTILVLALLGVATIPAIGHSFPRPESRWKELATFLEANTCPGDVVISPPRLWEPPSVQEVLEYYAPTIGHKTPFLQTESPRELQSAYQYHSRVWLLEVPLGEEGGNEEVAEWLLNTDHISVNFSPYFGVAYIVAGKSEESLLKDASKFSTSNAQAMIGLAKQFETWGMIDEARASLARVIELEPDNAEGHIRLGNLLQRTGGIEEAFIAYEKAIQLDTRLEPRRMNVDQTVRPIIVPLQSHTTYALDDRYSLLLGSPVYRCDGGVPVGVARLSQSFTVPSTGSPQLSFNYRVFTQDSLVARSGDSFDVYINNTLILRVGYGGNDYGCDVPGGHRDLGWKQFTYALTKYKGWPIRVTFVNANRDDTRFNTFTLVDDVRVSP